MAAETTNIASSVLLSLVLHVTAFSLTLYSVSFSFDTKPEVVVIQSKLLDEDQLNKEIAKYKQDKNKIDREKQKKLDALKKAAMAAELKQVEMDRIKKEQAEAAMRRAEDLIKKQQEEKRLSAAGKKKKEDMEKEKKRLALLKQQRLIEKKAAKRLKEEDDKKKKKAEQDLLAALDLEAMDMADQAMQNTLSTHMASMQQKWQKDIKNRIQRHWNKPSDMPSEFRCDFVIRINRSGQVLKVKTKPCSVGRLSSVAIDSMEKAIYKSEPLPKAPEPEVFDPEIHMSFQPKKEQ